MLGVCDVWIYVRMVGHMGGFWSEWKVYVMGGFNSHCL